MKQKAISLLLRYSDKGGLLGAGFFIGVITGFIATCANFGMLGNCT